MKDPAFIDFIDFTARIAAIEARIAGMLAENTMRTMRDETIAYGSEHFFEAEKELQEISETISKLYSR